MTNKRGCAVQFTVAAETSTDAIRVMGERDSFIEAALKHGWQIAGADSSPAFQKPKTTEPPDNRLPNCHCGEIAEVYSGISTKNGKPYTKYSCAKGFKSKDKCDFVQFA